MARGHGKNAVFKIDDSGGTLRDISAHVHDVSGLPGGRSLSDSTAFGDGGEKSQPGLANATFTVTGWIDTTATTGSYTVLNGLRTTTATASFEYGPIGSTSGYPKHTGECWLQDLAFDATVTDTVPFKATLKLDGVTTDTTY